MQSAKLILKTTEPNRALGQLIQTSIKTKATEIKIIQTISSVLTLQIAASQLILKNSIHNDMNFFLKYKNHSCTIQSII